MRSKKSLNEFDMVGGVLWYSDPARGSRPRLVPMAMRKEVMAEIYSGPFGGLLIYKELARRYYWRGMYADAYRHCQPVLSVLHTVLDVNGRGPIKASLPFVRTS